MKKNENASLGAANGTGATMSIADGASSSRTDSLDMDKHDGINRKVGLLVLLSVALVVAIAAIVAILRISSSRRGESKNMVGSNHLASGEAFNGTNTWPNSTDTASPPAVATAATTASVTTTSPTLLSAESSPPMTLPSKASPPTRLPEMSPTPLRPPKIPLNWTDRAAALTAFINNITLLDGRGSSNPLVVPLSFTPLHLSISAEQAALSWLVFNDTLQLWPQNDTTDATSRFRLQQRYALLTLLLQGVYINANLSANECDWSWPVMMLKCVESPGLGVNVVTELDITGYSTRPGSTLSPDLGLLTNLERLNVDYSGLTGTLPESLGTTWTHLEYFHVTDNALTGTLPSLLGMAWTNLESFWVSGNAFTGSLPPTLGMAWTNLEHFFASSNDLTASLPSSLGTSWTNLAIFSVNGNALTGSLPSSLGTSWTNLVTFEVDYNTLTGSLPSSLGSKWTNLGLFSVASNALTGTIPNDLARHWNKVALQLQRPLPAVSAMFYNNSLVGTMPLEFCTSAAATMLVADCDEVACSCCDDCCSDAAGCKFYV